jgi:signal transduction histidine kinase/ActR/RegA family two-component response regulator
MKSAPLTDDEEARIKALFDYEILDTEREAVFDDLTLLASQICDTPIALISLVDPDRQWFKSKVGLDANETERDIAFCAHAIHQREVFEVEDTLLDKRFFDNPLVTSGPNIRFYAGAPLVTPNGHAIGTLCTISDKPNKLTERQRNSLQILSREVVSQLELRTKVKQLDDANRRKTEYLSNVSHELRTPLNAIISFSQIMLNDADSQHLPEKFNQYVRHLDYSGRRLLDVINSVLDLNKIEEGKMDTETSSFNSKKFFDSLHSMMRKSAEQKGVLLDFILEKSVPETLVIDQAKLNQILINLTTNAIKFTPKNKQVTLTVSHSDNQLLLSLQDQGIGISKDDQNFLFDKFKQVEKNRSQEGSGLGLAITKGLVELLKGKIKLISQLGKGTLVEVNLPTSQVAVSKPNQNQQNIEQSFNVDSAILVVEDNMINQEVAQAIFESLGCTISLVETGELAIEKVQNEPFELVFMDLHLPGIDGYQTAQKIKKHFPELPIVALTADAFADNNSKELHPYLSDFLTKPIDKLKLKAVLNQYIPSKK